MASPSYKVGMIVEHPKRPEWGPGKVMAVGTDRLHVVFRDSLERKAKSIIRNIVTLNVSELQSDGVLDSLPIATQMGGDWVLPKNYERLISKAQRAAEAAVHN